MFAAGMPGDSNDVLLLWWWGVVVVGVCWWGCGVVVWELYSEREHLADEMSLMILFLGLLGV